MATTQTLPTDPAFPVAPNQSLGLTKREYFAAVALQGLLGNPYVGAKSVREDLAIAARAYADALIVEMNKL